MPQPPKTAAKPSPNRLPAPVRRYATHSRRPLVSLAFAAPLLVVYELGVVAFPDAARNGADAWMRGWLGAVGLAGNGLLPALTVVALLAWHHTTRQPWRLPRGVLLGMAGESVALGVLLLLVANAGAGWIGATAAIAGDSVMDPSDGVRLWVAWPAVQRLLARGVEYVGAGLYEEVLFRLMLLPATLATLAVCFDNRRLRVATAVGVTSLLFAAAHHAGPSGEPLVAGVFVFRTAAGAFFALLFLKRGFGIAIGAHAAYDLIAGLGYR